MPYRQKEDRVTKYKCYPRRIELPITSRGCDECGPTTMVHDDGDFRFCSNYPLINQIWRYNDQRQAWDELCPPPYACFPRYENGWRTKLSYSTLQTLHPVYEKPKKVVEGEKDQDDKPCPFASFEFEKQ